MEFPFDLIALPKGHIPGDPVQASNGDWYVVVPAILDLVSAMAVIEAARAGRPVTEDEVADCLTELTARKKATQKAE